MITALPDLSANDFQKLLVVPKTLREIWHGIDGTNERTARSTPFWAKHEDGREIKVNPGTASTWFLMLRVNSTSSWQGVRRYETNEPGWQLIKELTTAEARQTGI